MIEIVYIPLDFVWIATKRKALLKKKCIENHFIIVCGLYSKNFRNDDRQGSFTFIRVLLRQLLRFQRCLLAETKSPLENFSNVLVLLADRHANRRRNNPRSTYRGSEVVTDLVSKSDVRNRRWYVFAVVEEGDYTCVERFHATSVVLQDEIALVSRANCPSIVNTDPETMLYSRRRRISFVAGSRGERNLPRFSRKLRPRFSDPRSTPGPKFPSRSHDTWTCTTNRTRRSPPLEKVSTFSKF